MTTETTNEYDWEGRTLLDQEGEKIGKVSAIYVDDLTGRAEWATVHTGLFGSKSSFVPLAGAMAAGEDVRVAVTKAQVKDAPSVGEDDTLSEQDEEQLFAYYGVPYTPAAVTTQDTPPSAPVSSEDERASESSEEAMTRSEEELRVGTRQVEAGRVRLRKYVVTEMVTQTVPVRHEEVRVEREPITAGNRDQALEGPEITESEHEVVLHAEEPVVEKRVVPKERVSLQTDSVTEEREVSEEVRKEQIDLDSEGRR